MIFTSFLLDRCFFYLNSFPQKAILLRSTKYPEILYWQKIRFSLGTFDERKRYSLGISKLWGVRLLFLRWVGTSTFFILCFFYCLGRLLLWDSKLIDWDWSMCPAQAGERYQAPLLTSAMGFCSYFWLTLVKPEERHNCKMLRILILFFYFRHGFLNLYKRGRKADHKKKRLCHVQLTCVERIVLYTLKNEDSLPRWSLAPFRLCKTLSQGKTDNHTVGEKAKGRESMKVLSFEAQWSRKLQNTNGWNFHLTAFE